MRFWCTPHTAGRTLCFSPGTAGGTRRASSQQLQCCLLSPPDPEEKHSQKVAGERERCAGAHWLTRSPSHLLVFGDWVQQLHVQFGVVLRQRLVAIVVDELHHGAEGERVREPILPIPMKYLD